MTFKVRRHVLTCASLLLATVVSTSFAEAQETTPPPPPTTTPSDTAKAEARQQFDAGVALLDDPDGARYEQAYHAFKRAYELSGSVKILGNVGFCAMKLERDGEAIDSYTQYLREVTDIDEREKAQIQKDLLTLTSTVGRMEVTVKHAPGKFALVDHRNQTRGEPIENAYPFEGNKLSIRLRPGRHTFKVTVNGTEDSLPYDVSIEPNGSASHEFVFAPPPSLEDPNRPRKAGSHAGPIILGVMGAAGLANGVVFGILGRNKEDDIQKNCPANNCPATYDLARNRTKAKTLGTVADISFIAGGSLLGAAIIWYVLVPSASEPKTRASAGGALPPSKSTSTSSTVRSWLSSTSAMCTAAGCNVSLQRGF